MNKTLLVAGSIAFDSLKTRAGSRDEILGGAATYISIAASYFSKVNLVAVVGKNDFPKECSNLLKKHNIDLTGLEFADGRTFRWQGEYADDFSTRQTLGTELGVFEKFDPKIPEEYIGPQILLLGNISPSVQLKVLERAKGTPFVITDTMNLWMDIALDDLKKIISKSNLLVINDEEAFQLSKKQQLITAAKDILKLGPEFLIIKRGEHGAFLFTAKDTFYSPAILLEDVIDPTGAGDSFAGGLAGYLAKTGATDFTTIKTAMLYGTAIASATCEGFGTEKTITLTNDEIESRVAKLKALVSLH
ncbi:MAG: sugar kinase [Deltaproteobacteria bacterium]|nr:sugar kinase [Deltaproteobacteria bacterium]